MMPTDAASTPRMLYSVKEFLARNSIGETLF